MAQATTRDDDFIANVQAAHTAERERELTDPAQPYMRNAHLLPPRDEYESVDEYVRLLERFARVPATEASFYRFLPTIAQRRANAAVLAQWHAAQQTARGPRDKRKRAQGFLIWRCFTGDWIGVDKAPALAKLSEGNRDTQTNAALRYLAPLVNDGSLSHGELADAIIGASQRNGHIPDNKSRAQVEADIDRAIGMFTEPFDWGRPDDDR
jgi:hypothetical protein